MASKITRTLPHHPYKCGVTGLHANGDSDRRFVDTGRDIQIAGSPKDERLYLADSFIVDCAHKLGMVFPSPQEDVVELRAENARLSAEVDRLAARLEKPEGFIEVNKANRQQVAAMMAYKNKVDNANADVDGFVKVPLPKKYQDSE